MKTEDKGGDGKVSRSEVKRGWYALEMDFWKQVLSGLWHSVDHGVDIHSCTDRGENCDLSGMQPVIVQFPSLYKIKHRRKGSH